ncbi:HWE histidine kinase domain-containing protein [Qipengyuania sp. CAU 1752]
MNIPESLETKSGLSISTAYQLVTSTAGHIGEAFFPAVAKAIAEAVGVRWVLISKLHRTNSGKAETVAAWDNGPSDNMVYDLAGSPCENILTQGSCKYAFDLQDRFPADSMLQEMGAHSYVGTPLRSSSGKVLGLIAVLHDAPMRNESEIAAAVELVADRTGAELERLAARTLTERLGRMVEESVSEAYVFSGDTYKFELVNSGARENLGYSMEELSELTPWDIKPDFSEEEFKAFVAPLLAGEVKDQRFETRHQRKDGSFYQVDVRLQFYPGVDNVFFASITDITDRKESEHREKLLAREVNHRSKNLLSLVQVIARQTSARHPTEYVSRLEERIAALAANQDVLVNSGWRRIPLEALVESQLAHLKGFQSRITTSGPAVQLKPPAAQAIGMAIHELATNAIKYGALSDDEGIISIDWTVDPNKQKFVFRWVETGGPEVTEPQDKGFGSVVIVRQPQAALKADVTIEYRKEGLFYQIESPSELVLDTGVVPAND